MQNKSITKKCRLFYIQLELLFKELVISLKTMDDFDEAKDTIEKLTFNNFSKQRKRKNAEDNQTSFLGEQESSSSYKKIKCH